MTIRPFRSTDAGPLSELSHACARGESDFVLNPLWETEDELAVEFERRGIEPEDHLLVADGDDGRVEGMVGFLCMADVTNAGLLCPIVEREARGRGLGGELLRAALTDGAERLGIKFLSAGIGTRNRAGYSLLTSLGFRPVRQIFLMRCEAQPKPAKVPIDGVEFSPASESDAEPILSIYTDCGFDPRSLEIMRAAMTDGRHTHAVARRNDEIVAFTELETHWPNRPWVAYVGVSPELRDRGLGSALVSWSLARCFQGGAQSALLILSPANRTAVRAYEKVGFRRHRSVDVLEKGL